MSVITWIVNQIVAMMAMVGVKATTESFFVAVVVIVVVGHQVFWGLLMPNSVSTWWFGRVSFAAQLGALIALTAIGLTVDSLGLGKFLALVGLIGLGWFCFYLYNNGGRLPVKKAKNNLQDLEAVSHSVIEQVDENPELTKLINELDETKGTVEEVVTNKVT